MSTDDEIILEIRDAEFDRRDAPIPRAPQIGAVRPARMPCRKQRFATDVEALIALIWIALTDYSRTPVYPVRHYPCPRCHGHHLTSMPLATTVDERSV